jgi:hypothetical protein
LHPKSFSHDWHVQPSCQRPNRPPPERRAFGTDRIASSANPTVLETLQTYRAAHVTSTRASHRISTRFPQWEFRTADGRELTSGPKSPNSLSYSRRGLKPHPFKAGARSGMAFRPEKRSFPAHGILGRAKAEDRKLRKDPFGGPCLEGTLQKLQFHLGSRFPNQAPWPGRFRDLIPV